MTYDEPVEEPFRNRWGAWRPQPRNVTPSRAMLEVAEGQRHKAEQAGGATRTWAVRAAIGFGLMLVPTPLMPVFFLYFVFAAIMAATAAIAAWNARTGAQLARDSAMHPDRE